MIDYRTSRTHDPHGQGLYIAAVSYNNNFQVGDRIVGVNGIEVATCNQVKDIIGACQAGDAVSVTVMRDNLQIEVDVTLTESDTTAANPQANPAEHAA